MRNRITINFLCLMGFLLVSCNEHKTGNTKDEGNLGNYVYVDHRNVIHTDRKCKKLNDRGFKSNRFPVKEMFFYFQDTPIGEISFCPYCVSDKEYESIIESFSKQIEERVNEIIEETANL